MIPAIPYPLDDVLFSAAAVQMLLPCHQCAGRPGRRPDCPACLGSGFIRPCARCFRNARTQAQSELPCVVCCGLHYTAANPPEREDRFHCRPHLTAHALRTAEA